MAQIRTPYVAIDDTQVDAESPITESLMFAMRDQWFGALADAATIAPDSERVQLPERAKTDETNTASVLKPDGSGGVLWGDGVDISSGEDTAAAFATIITLTHSAMTPTLGNVYRFTVTNQDEALAVSLSSIVVMVTRAHAGGADAWIVDDLGAWAGTPSDVNTNQLRVYMGNSSSSPNKVRWVLEKVRSV